MNKFDDEPIIRKALIGVLGIFYKKIVYPSKDGEIKSIPMVLDNNRDRTWNSETYENMDFKCGFDKLNGEAMPVPRATIVYKPIQVDFSEFLNDNIRVKVVERKEMADDVKVNRRANFVPITIPIELIIISNTLNEAFWIIESMISGFESEKVFKINHNGVENIMAQLVPEVSASTTKSGNISVADKKDDIEITINFDLKFTYPKLIDNIRYPNSIESKDVNVSTK